MLFLAGLLAVAAARDVPRTAPDGRGRHGVMMSPPVIIVVFFGGMIAGQILTSIAGNPPVNGADTDLTYGLPGLVLGVMVAAVTHVVTAVPGPAGPASHRACHRAYYRS